MVMMMMANISFVLLKINDIDVGRQQQQQQDTALNLLLSAETEDIVLQLKRKSCWDMTKSADDCNEIEISKQFCFLKIQQTGTNNSCPDTAGLPSTKAVGAPEIIVSLHLPNSAVDNYGTTKSTQTDDMAFYVHEQLRNIQKDTERLIEEEHNLFEQSLAPEIDIEEITLRKVHSNERLGLTVCYSNGEEYGDGGDGGGSGNEVYGGTSVTEVYISDIHADSVAGRDGRLRQGDQILQINGKDITTREETETLIAENNNAVTLLISRYLYGEDDFNDPSTNEDEDEVLVVEDDEDDDDEEFYDENNMTYVNCMANNDCCLNNVEDFDKAIMSQVDQQQKREPQGLLMDTNDTAETSTVIVATTANKDKTKNSKNDKKVSNASRNVTNQNTSATAVEIPGKATSSAMSKLVSDNKTSDYYESEHIYETIPEDPESEPFYCSPYDSSVYVTAIASCSSSTVTDAFQQQMQHKQRVVQWLGINPAQGICATAMPRQSIRSSSGCGRSLKHRHKTTSSTIRSTMTSLTNGSVDAIGSAMTLPASAQVDDQDNSSSAYNTGGSNNSVSPHSLVLNSKSRTEPYHAAGCVPNASASASADDVLGMQQLLLQHKMVSQQKVLSPKDKNKITSPKSTNKLPAMDMQIQSNVPVGGGGKNSMYTNNDVNMQRTAMVQQHLVKQTLSMDKAAQQPYYQHQLLEQMHCPQFTAPNLSQYHFVSSQEVNNLSLNNKIPKSSPIIAETASNTKNDEEDEAMVWKVKRRPDGTRYIVRRPAKSRVIKERNVRLNVERLRDDNTTTEDDTMSEIKTGRYWTREERKKHIEKAKERRQQQQLQYQQQLLHQHKATHNNATTFEENAPTELQDREKMRNAHFLSFSRQKYRQHYQLQFNSAHAEAAQKHKSSLNYHNTTLPSAALEDATASAGTEQADAVLGTVTTTTVAPSHLTASSEHNNINSAMISVTTV